MWHMQDSPGQLLALTFRYKPLQPFTLLQCRSDAGVLNPVVDKATWKMKFKLSWREASPPNHLVDTVDSDRLVVNTDLFLQVL